MSFLMTRMCFVFKVPWAHSLAIILLQNGDGSMSALQEMMIIQVVCDLRGCIVHVM